VKRQKSLKLSDFETCWQELKVRLANVFPNNYARRTTAWYATKSKIEPTTATNRL
jgi:hypothetical protein